MPYPSLQDYSTLMKATRQFWESAQYMIPRKPILLAHFSDTVDRVQVCVYSGHIMPNVRGNASQVERTTVSRLHWHLNVAVFSTVC